MSVSREKLYEEVWAEPMLKVAHYSAAGHEQRGWSIGTEGAGSLVTMADNTPRWVGIPAVPMLVLDDEADNASINTRGDEDPTVINGLIRDLLSRFEKNCYVGYTATPFANIFINPDSSDDLLGIKGGQLILSFQGKF